MDAKTLPIACAIDHHYALPLMVMLASIQRHLRSSYRIQLFLVHRGLRQSLLEAISRLVETCSLVPDQKISSALTGRGHFPPEASYPLLLPQLLPNSLDRVLFLDADLLVLDDLASLWETPMDGHALAAVPDRAIPLCNSPRGLVARQSWGVPDNAPYFNGGVMLMNLAAWREGDVAACACRYLEEAGRRVNFIHQEALNAILWNDWLPLDGRWNVLASLAGRPYAGAHSDCENAGIVHFAGRFKPWRAPIGGPFDKPYREALSRVADYAPAPKPTLADKLLSLYDRHARNSLYTCERALWDRGLI